ncbi:uncharacterized protein BHQ10_004976 [Talaromyces amestolkiae]|uniref:EthD domain-containing protein n=1 Tax=Talaromyces amestolkiae TaxID=1196081 RepID=A0A364KZK5_TALAM|nr:uncharacterized protein BHQ10_004976 [Talaromyces amestolkiae]RAO68964.1 hypothetical protein BHQ10_004976 [Talaromyces amestolkiae]
MQLTILSDKLPTLSETQFAHEFRTVHAQQTRAIAINLGIILKYVQGLALPTVGRPKLINLPLEELQYRSFAQLTWPSLEVLQGSFSTEDYRQSAAKHQFARPFQLFLTERDESSISASLNTSSTTLTEIEKTATRLVVTVIPKTLSDNENTKFEEQWSRHAQWVCSLGASYTRYRVIPLDETRSRKIFDGTPFDPRLVVTAGGYDEFMFQSQENAAQFLAEHGPQLRSSYLEFVDIDHSHAYAFDHVVQFGTEDRGTWQTIFGLLVGSALRVKVFFGI